MVEEQELEQEQELEMGENPEETPKKKGRGLLWFMLLLLIGGIGAGGYFFTRRAAAAKKPSEPGVKAVLHLDEFIVNLADTEQRSFLRIGIDLGVDREPPKEEAKMLRDKALIRDTILTVLSTRKADELLTLEGKTKLKEALVQALQERVWDVGVRDVYFNEFLVQR